VIALLFVVDKDYSTLMMIMVRQLNIKLENISSIQISVYHIVDED